MEKVNARVIIKYGEGQYYSYRRREVTSMAGEAPKL